MIFLFRIMVTVILATWIGKAQVRIPGQVEIHCPVSEGCRAVTSLTIPHHMWKKTVSLVTDYIHYDWFSGFHISPLN